MYTKASIEVMWNTKLVKITNANQTIELRMQVVSSARCITTGYWRAMGIAVRCGECLQIPYDEEPKVWQNFLSVSGSGI